MVCWVRLWGGGAFGNDPYQGTGGRPKVPQAGNDPPNVPVGNEEDNAASALITPLTSALEKLSLAVDPSATSHKLRGIHWKPEYYVQHVKQGTPLKQVDHTKLTYKDLVFGWFCVLQQLLRAGGDVESYVGHCKFVSERAMANQFNDSSLVDYDRYVVSKVIEEELDSFPVGDSLGVSSNFHAGNLIPKSPKTQRKGGFKKWGSGKWGKKFDKSPENADKSPTVPDGFPEDICYAFNYKRCTSTNCSKKHICRSCGGSHRAQGCSEKPRA